MDDKKLSVQNNISCVLFQLRKFKHRIHQFMQIESLFLTLTGISIKRMAL